MPDPTLLLTPAQWEMIAFPVSVSKPYLLCYFLGQNEGHWRSVWAIAKKLGLPVVVIPVHGKDMAREYQMLGGVGPCEFLGLIQNASFVCTDSFHGTLFSVLYERPFCTFKRFSDSDKHSQNTRIYNFLRIIELEDHLYTGKPIGATNQQTSWDRVREGLSLLRTRGLAYLEKALSEITADVGAQAPFHITNTCSGCGACSFVCPSGAATMNMQEGFYQAQVDQNKCIRCRKCEKICAFRGSNGKPIDDEHASLFMARSISRNTLEKSASGGVAYEISRFFNRNGLPILGCVFENHTLEARHVMVPGNCEEQLTQFQGSKYMQSDFTMGFLEILEQEQGVVFGLPCQIAGADKFLRLKGMRDHFLLVDLICHGVPTKYLIQRHIKEIQAHCHITEISEICFRYKPKGWKQKYMYISGGGKRYLKAASKDNFYLYFDLQNCYMRSCYDCNYRVASCADLRLGDYWGPKYAHCHPEGVSMVVSFSERGQNILHTLAEQDILELHKEPNKDYYSVQFPENPIIPLYREPLIQVLGDQSDTRNLKALAHDFFPIPMYNRQLIGVWHKVKKHWGEAE